MGSNRGSDSKRLPPLLILIIFFFYIHYFCGGRGSVVRESEFKPEDPGFDPLAGQGEEYIFLSLRVNSCADLFVPDPPFRV